MAELGRIVPSWFVMLQLLSFRGERAASVWTVGMTTNRWQLLHRDHNTTYEWHSHMFSLHQRRLVDIHPSPSEPEQTSLCPVGACPRTRSHVTSRLGSSMVQEIQKQCLKMGRFLNQTR